MGFGASKCSEGSILTSCKSEGCLVKLCKERRDLIGAARDFKFSLSASHVLYFQSLLDIGEALDDFVKEPVVVGIDSEIRSEQNDGFQLIQGVPSSSTQVRYVVSHMIRSSVETTSELHKPEEKLFRPLLRW
uniref:DUF630 domain-containing protein n=1 Tax=Kalanchoe fedtschenkoi TaxID=63787 RepID=A0A7N0TRG7_KALFE